MADKISYVLCSVLIKLRIKNHQITTQKKTLFLLLCLTSVLRLDAQSPVDLSFRFTETQVNEQAHSLRFRWLPLSDLSTQIKIYKKLSGELAYTQIATLSGVDTTYTDTAVNKGDVYDYNFESYKANGTTFARTFIHGGIRKAEVDYRGKVVLLVDDIFSKPLENEISRLSDDIEGDGWRVIRYNVARSASPQAVKSIIQNEYNSDPSNVKSVFILGHLAVPYSGDINPDAHTDHKGAWPCDGYYADMTGSWTDTQVNDITAADPRNRNIPGDGKFDQSSFSNDVTLEIGRVDFNDLPEFTKSESELMRQYLDKNHNFRHGIMPVRRAALIDDNFGYFGGETLGTGAWRSFAPMFPNSAIITNDYRTFTYKEPQGYLWAYGCGFGDYSSVGNVTHTMYLASEPHGAVFNMLFGSYSGDWDSRNNILRAVLASQGSGLACFWAGRPFGIVHHMAMGETIGKAMNITMNNFYKYPTNSYASLFYRMVHVGLMGDPTLRMHVVSPPANVLLSGVNGAYHLSWTKSVDADVEGYNIYIFDAKKTTYTKINPSLITDSYFVDKNVYPFSPEYLVKSVKTEITNSGSYQNQSQGIIISATNTSGTGYLPGSEISVSPNPVIKSSELTISLTADMFNANIELIDIAGHIVYSVKSKQPISRITIPGNLAAGVYRLKLAANDKVIQKNIIVR